MTNYANQPYGQQMPAPHSPQPHSAQQTYKVMRRYGLVYMGVRGGYLILILVLLVFLTSMLSEQGIKGPAAESRNETMAILIVVFLAWLVYTGVGGWLATKGNIAGVYMGVVDVVIVAILTVIGASVSGEVLSVVCWGLGNVAIAIMAGFAFKEYYGDPSAAGYPPPTRPEPGPGYGAPGHPQQQGPMLPQGPGAMAAPWVPSPSSPSPKQAVLGILHLAASVDPDHEPEGLKRARTAAVKLHGPAAQARVQQTLNGSAEITDIDQDLMRHTMVLNQQGNEKTRAATYKAAKYVLSGRDGVIPMGEGFLASLKQQLNIQ